MMRSIATLFYFLLCALAIGAQSRTTLVQRINEIKNNSDVYFWDQYTHPDADTAKVNATKRLLLAVNDGRSKDDEMTVDGIMPHAAYITIDRGNLKQSFVYIKKEDASRLTDGMPAQQLSLVQETPAPVFVEGAASEVPQHQMAFVPDAFVQRIMETRYFMDIHKLLTSLKAQGQILQFGKLRDVEDYSSLDLILFDVSSQEVITMLSPKNDMGQRTNLVNGYPDSIRNYPQEMTAVIWYIKK